jgi:uncharacterized protein YciI
MKKLLLFYIVFLLTANLLCGQDASPKTKTPGPKIEQYWFVLLKTGPKTDFDSSSRAKLFQGHMSNMERLYYDGILKVAGPFGKNEFTWRGLFIFDCKTREEAEKIASTDPAVAAGLFAVDIVPWYSEPTGSFVHGKPERKE